MSERNPLSSCAVPFLERVKLIQKFWSTYWGIVRRHPELNDPAWIVNVDEVRFYLEAHGVLCLAEKNEKRAEVLSSGHEKTGVTVILFSVGNGTMLPAVILVAGKSLKTLKIEVGTNDGVIVIATKNGWNTAPVYTQEVLPEYLPATLSKVPYAFYFCSP